MATAIQGNSIQVIGLTEFIREVKEVDPKIASEMTKAFRTIAKEIRDKSQQEASGFGGVRAHVAPSIKASAGMRGASISVGGPDFPMALGAEFGSIEYHQFPAWRGNLTDAGYMVYPTIRAYQDKAEQLVVDSFLHATDQAFPD